jgi:hypothetical protein
MWRRRKERLLALLDLELAVADTGVVRLDHSCAGAGMHRLLGIELSDAERALLVAGKTVAVSSAATAASGSVGSFSEEPMHGS